MPQTLRSDTFSSLMCNVDATTHHNWIVAVFWTRPKMARWMESAEKPNVSSLQQCIFLKTQGTVYIPKFIMQLDNWTLNTSWEHGPTVQHYQHVPNSGGVVRATFILERTQLNLDVHLLKSRFGPTCSASAKRFNDSKQAAQDAYRNWFHVRDANFRRFLWSFCIKIGSLFRFALR